MAQPGKAGRGRAVICQGAGFGQWEGRTWGEASNTSLVSSCSGGRQIQFASSYVSLTLDRAVRSVEFRPDGEYVAVGTASGSVRIFSVGLVRDHLRLHRQAEADSASNFALIRFNQGVD